MVTVSLMPDKIKLVTSAEPNVNEVAPVTSNNPLDSTAAVDVILPAPTVLEKVVAGVTVTPEAPEAPINTTSLELTAIALTSVSAGAASK